MKPHLPVTGRGTLRTVTLIIVLTVICMLAGPFGGTADSSSAHNRSGTSNARPPRAAVTLTYLSTQNQQLIKPAIDQFNKTHPGIRVVQQFLPFDQLFQQIQVRLGAKSAQPDIVDVDAPVVAAYAVQGFLAPINSSFSKRDLAQFVPSTLGTGYYRGRLLAPPINSSSQVLYYNKDLLRKARVPFPRNSFPPRKADRLTWEKLATLAQKATFRSHSQVTAWGLVIDQIDRVYQLLPLPESLGGQAISKDEIHAGGIINSPPWVKAFAYYYNLFNKWQVSPKGATDAATAGLFASGHASFFWGGPWNVPTFLAAKNLHWGVAPTPYFAGGKVITPNDSWHLGVSRYSKHVAQAAQFVRYMTAGRGNDIYVNAIKQVPSLKRQVRRIEDSPAYSKFPDNVLRLATWESAHTAVPRPVTPGYTEYQDITTQAFNNMRSGQAVKAALDAAASQIDRALAKYRHISP
jgi:ABC-type glycerol-3-phosphate transport system substrate-binding protein